MLASFPRGAFYQVPDFWRNSRCPQAVGEGVVEFDYWADMGHLIHGLDASVDQKIIAEELSSEVVSLSQADLLIIG